MTVHFHPLDPETVATLRGGGPDANGLPAEHAISGGTGYPCRNCLQVIPEGAPMLIFAMQPFKTLHPYAELGPAFLCADDCTAYAGPDRPKILDESPDYLVKGYGTDERIVYGTGRITPKNEVESYAATLLSRPDIAYVDVRSARNNCWLTRITEAP